MKSGASQQAAIYSLLQELNTLQLKKTLQIHKTQAKG